MFDERKWGECYEISKEAKGLLYNYLTLMLTDRKLAKGYKTLTGKNMLNDEIGFEFMTAGNTLFHKYHRLSSTNNVKYLLNN